MRMLPRETASIRMGHFWRISSCVCVHKYVKSVHTISIHTPALCVCVHVLCSTRYMRIYKIQSSLHTYALLCCTGGINVQSECVCAAARARPRSTLQEWCSALACSGRRRRRRDADMGPCCATLELEHCQMGFSVNNMCAHILCVHTRHTRTRIHIYFWLQRICLRSRRYIFF